MFIKRIAKPSRLVKLPVRVDTINHNFSNIFFVKTSLFYEQTERTFRGIFSNIRYHGNFRR